MDKNSQLKDNVDQAIARSQEVYVKEHRTQMPEKQKKKEKKEFLKAANVTEKHLPYLWNQEKDNTPEPNKSNLEFGQYFGGVNFDENGKIIRE